MKTFKKVLLSIHNKIEKISFKPILMAMFLIQGSILSFCFFGRIFNNLCEPINHYLASINISYLMEDLGKAIAWLVFVIPTVIFGIKKTREMATKWLKNKYDEFTILILFVYNLIFGVLIYFGNVFLKDFNNYINQKYEK